MPCFRLGICAVLTDPPLRNYLVAIEAADISRCLGEQPKTVGAGIDESAGVNRVAEVFLLHTNRPGSGPPQNGWPSVGLHLVRMNLDEYP